MAERAGVVSGRACLGCAAALADPFLDLGAQPLANAFVRPEDAARPEPRFPLAVASCARCHLVQLTATAPPAALFDEYLYFTSYSEYGLAHARAMAATLSERFARGPGRRVLEIASNDGCLLQFFLERGVPVLGVEPAVNVAAAAAARGIPTLARYSGPDVSIGTDVLEFTMDRSPYKQGRLVPGVRVPIRPVEDLLRETPDFKGGAFIVGIPTPRVIGAAP